MFPNEYIAQELRQQQLAEHMQRQAIEQAFRSGEPELGERLMEGASNALIALGKRLKPRPRPADRAYLVPTRQLGTRSR
jgi:hypothetical protein